jgi:hypothetical protein
MTEEQYNELKGLIYEVLKKISATEEARKKWRSEFRELMVAYLKERSAVK